MLALHSFETFPGIPLGIENTNPAMVSRLRRMAETMTGHEIAASLTQAITESADAAHLRAFEEFQFGQASADAQVDAEYAHELVQAWSLVAGEYQVFTLIDVEAAH